MRGDVAGTTRAAAPPGSRRYAELSTYTREARGHHRDGPQMSLSDCPGRCRTSPPAVLWSVHLRSTERRPNALTVKGEGWGTHVPHGVSCTQTFLSSHRRAGPLAGGWAQPGHWDAARPDSTVPGSEGPTQPSGPVPFFFFFLFLGFYFYFLLFLFSQRGTLTPAQAPAPGSVPSASARCSSTTSPPSCFLPTKGRSLPERV